MTLARRDFLSRAGVALAAGAVAAPRSLAEPREDGDGWAAVRGEFALSDEFIHMSALLISSHPRIVREAIDEHRRALDADPVAYLQDNNDDLRDAALAAAAGYLDIDPSGIALTDSTTMGIGLVYNGVRLAPGDRILLTENDYYVTDEALRLAAQRTGASVRKVALYNDVNQISADQMVGRIARAVTPQTRVLAVTWVHSNTGLKLPLGRIAEALAEANAGRDEDDRVLFCVDGVHGFGVEDMVLSDLGCDVFMAGCHKWLFGPRGTGIVAARSGAWRQMTPTIPSFIDDDAWSAWLEDRPPRGPTTARGMTPGGFKAFEHQWALAQAFAFHRAIGKPQIAARTHQLAAQLKDGLAQMPHVTLHTPRSADLSAGIVAFDVAGMAPAAAVARLRERRIIASAAPYATPHVRLTPSIRNLPDEIEAALRAIRALA